MFRNIVILRRAKDPFDARSAFLRAEGSFVAALHRMPLAALLIGASPAHAQEHPISITGRIAGSNVVQPGGRASVLVRATIPTGWHLYGLSEPPGGPIATSIAVGPPSLARIAGPVAADEPVSAPDPNFGLTTSTYADSARFTVPIAFDSLVHGKNLLAVRVGYQTCNARYCLPPREDVIGVDLRVEGTVASSGTNSATVPPIAVASPSPLPGQSASGTENRLLFLWLAATMGALSLLTPCVFPMVPITISYFSTHERGSRRRAAADAAIYAIGIVGAFTGLGLGMSVVFGTAALSRFAANPWLNLAVAALFVSFALSLFGVVDLALPAGLVNRVERLSRQDRYGRVGTTLLIGATFAVTSFTCTAPLVGTLLVSATQGDWRWPAIGLFVFSCVFALPFLILALVPRALNRLPRSGSWMVALKGTLAFIELGAAMKFLSNADMVSGWGVFTRGVVLAIWAALAVGLALYLAGLRVRNHRVSFATTRYRLGALTAVVAGAWLASGIGGRRLGEAEAFLPPAGAGSSGIVRSRELPWRIDDYDAALAEARASGRLLLVDFTGYTCTNCRWMEANMFPREDVRRALDRFVRVRLFTDGRTDRDREQQIFEQKQFNTVALPLYAVVDPTGRPQRTFLGMTRDTDEFVRFLAGTPKPN